MAGLSLAVFLFAIAVANAQLPTDCGRSAVEQNLVERIVGGSEATPYSWPWQLSLRVYGGHTCGASIISTYYAVTAAHCTEGYSTSSFTLHAGRHSELGSAPYEQVGYPQKMWQHEYYNSYNIDNDITLFRMQKPFTFNNYVRAVCLPSSALDTSGTEMWATGWGEVQGTCCQGKLKQTMLPLVSRSTCQSYYYGSGITNGMICAGRGGSSSDNVCMGDSGGPLVTKRNGVWELHGASSWVGSQYCAQGSPGVFTNIYYYKSWILSKIYQAEAEEERIAQSGLRPIPVGAAFRTMRGQMIEEGLSKFDVVPVQE